MSSIAPPRKPFAPLAGSARTPYVGGGGAARRFTVEEYHRLLDAGVLTEDDPVELLEGVIVYKMPRNPPHDATVAKVDLCLRARLPAGWTPRIQSAITTADSEPEPDFALARGTPDDYMQAHPAPGDLALVLEVANSSLELDRHQKAQIYARAGVRVYWIVNLVDRILEVYTEPSGPTELPNYRQQQAYAANESVTLALPGTDAIVIPVAEMLPAAQKTC
jgi:Uma2 family endonuclease